MLTTANRAMDWADNQRRRYQVAGVSFALKVTAEESGGICSMVEVTVPPNFAGSAPHIHERTTEVFYLLNGVMAFTLGQETTIVRPGDVLRVPPGMVHRFWNPSAAPATYLAFLTPGGFEGYFVELAERFTNESSWPPADLSQMFAIGAKYDIVPA